MAAGHDAPARAAARRWRRLPTTPVSGPVRWFVYLFALSLFVGIVSLRGGPAVDDAFGVTRPATALANGDLAAAAQASVLPQPPGYALLSAPFVAALGSVVGSPTWCDDQVPAVVRALWKPCAVHEIAHQHWYRSQALLGILAWVVLAAGAVSLLRAAGAGGGFGELVLVLSLAALPAASDGIVETFHPQDLVCTGLIAAGMAQALRRRWLVTGAVFGVAMLCKQFAVLPLLAVVAAAPDWRGRLRVLAPAVAVVGAGVLPFYVVDPSGTLRALGAVNAQGVASLTTGTVLGITHLSESAKLVVARDGPVLFASLLALWAWWRLRAQLLRPTALVGLAAACLAGRLVFEVWFAGYYLLATACALIVLDLVAGQWPLWSFAWIASTAVMEARAGGLPTGTTSAVLSLGAALAAVGLGLRGVRRVPSTAVAGAAHPPGGPARAPGQAAWRAPVRSTPCSCPTAHRCGTSALLQAAPGERQWYW